jgi:hypothetical protein
MSLRRARDTRVTDDVQRHASVHGERNRTAGLEAHMASGGGVAASVGLDISDANMLPASTSAVLFMAYLLFSSSQALGMPIAEPERALSAAPIPDLNPVSCCLGTGRGGVRSPRQRPSSRKITRGSGSPRSTCAHL